MSRALVTLLSVAGLAGALRMPAAGDRVVVERVPEAGLVAQAVTDRSGVVHIVYLTGDPAAGDVHYVRREIDGRYETPIQVNRRPGSAIALGTIRGPQVAIGRGGRVHVIWNGSQRTGHAPGDGLPLYYARSGAAGGPFDAERNVVTWATGLDGGGAVAADEAGRVFVAWHANPAGGPDRDRRVYLARSDDDGTRFGREEPVSPPELGACACCGMRAMFGRDGAFYVAFRAAGRDIHRDMTLLVSRDLGVTFRPMLLDPWEINACPLSTVALAEGPAGITAAWETQGQVRVADVASRLGPTAGPASNQAGTQKHPVVTYNSAGERLVAWLEGTGWARGGAVAWQHFDRLGRKTESAASIRGVPPWGLAAVAALPDGRFLVLY